MINTALNLKNYSSHYKLNILENKINIKEKTRNNDEMKLHLIIHKLL